MPSHAQQAALDRAASIKRQTKASASPAVLANEAIARSGSMASRADQFSKDALKNFGFEETPPDRAVPQYVNRNRHDHLREAIFPSLAKAPGGSFNLTFLRDADHREGQQTFGDVDEQMALQAERAERLAHLKSITDPAYAARIGNEVVGENHPSAVQARALLAETDLKKEGHERRVAERKRSTVRPVVSMLEQKLDAHRGVKFHDIEPVKPTADYETIIANETKLDVEEDRVKNARPSVAEVRATIQAQVDALAQAGAPVVRADGRLTLPTARTPQGAPGIVVSHDQIAQLIQPNGTSAPDGVAFSVWLQRDAVLERLLADVPQGSGGMTAAAKKKRLEEIATERLALERQEAALVWASNGKLRFRPNADFRSILCIE